MLLSNLQWPSQNISCRPKNSRPVALAFIHIPSPPIPRTRRIIQVTMIVDSYHIPLFGVVDAISRTDDVLDEVDDAHCLSLG